MSTVTFDTLGWTRRLEGKGFQREQAEEISLVLKEAVEEGRGEVATKTDLKAGLDALELRLLKWFATGVIAQTLILGGLMIRLLGK